MRTISHLLRSAQLKIFTGWMDAGLASEGRAEAKRAGEQVSERSERAFWKTRAMNPAKWLQTATSTTKLTHPIRLSRSFRSSRSSFIKNAHNLASLGAAGRFWISLRPGILVMVEQGDRDSVDNTGSAAGERAKRAATSTTSLTHPIRF